MFLPNGLLTTEDVKHDVEVNPHIIAPDPAASDDCFDVFPPPDLFLLTTTEELKMNAGDDDSSSSLNGRLRPRKSNILSPKTKSRTKSEGRTPLDKPKRTSNPSKTSPNKQDDLPNKSDTSLTPYFLCPYCDKKFASKQTLSKHIQRMHYSKPDAFLRCLFCNQTEADSGIIQHMVNSHPNHYFACLDCNTRFLTTSELAEHKLNICEKLKVSYRTKLRQKEPRDPKKSKKSSRIGEKDDSCKSGKELQEDHTFNGIVISCELKPSEDQDGADIEDNITTNLILPTNKNLGTTDVLKKNAVIVLDELQWNKKIPSNFSFHSTDADQILSRLGVVHRSPRTGESTKKDWFKTIDDTKFEKCFDTKFYSKVASNVQENLAKFLDGTCNFNPDPDSTIKTRKSKNNVVINTAEGFPILLACEQYSRNINDGYMPRAIAPKHKWKWDSPESDKGPLNPDQIKRDSHTNNCIITLVSSLDIWTQLSMRRKFDNIFNIAPIEKKTEKQNIISQELKEILESRVIPTSSLQIVKHTNKPATITSASEFPAYLGLAPAAPTYEMQPAVLSGEWVRPRCYVCCACGEQTLESKGLSLHISTQHPNANVQYYEIVGEPLLNADILKHLYVPPSQVCNRTRPPRGFRECTKCQKSVTLEDLHQHMLDCAGDTPTVRRRQGRSRPFGVRRRRPRMPDNTIRKKMRKDIRSQQRRQKTHMRPRPRARTEVGDAETIRKMLADLPAKRHRVVVNPVSMIQRPRRMVEKERPKMIMKKNAQGAKNMKKCGNNRILSDRKTKSVNTDNANQNSNFDDEDNKPLRPKLKSLINKSRQRETLKRQSVVNRVKRKSIRVEQRKVVDDTDKILEAASNPGIEKASLGETPQRMDLKRGTYNTREHGNRSASGNGDGQRPSCSGTNGNENNSVAPTQNVPLKHSIARLTANSETHDKSVQFHHSFLVQQECNNTNQHVPTGQQILFENEAVVTRLDKPPLNFCQKGLLDLNALQKSKLNKPRKGLNDCIAMLKNKLVDPLPQDTPGHVSVQCGNDDPIDPDPRPLIQVSTNKDAVTNVNMQPNVSQSRPVPSTYVEYHPIQEKSHTQPSSGVEIIPKPKQSEVVVKRKSPRGKPYNNELRSAVSPLKMIPPSTEINVSQQKHAVTRFCEKSPAKTRSRSDTRRSSWDTKPHVVVSPNDLNKLRPADIESNRKKSPTAPYKTKTHWQKINEEPKNITNPQENVTLVNQLENRQNLAQHDVRQDMRHDNIQEMMHDISQKVRHDVTKEVRHNISKEVRPDIRQELRHDIRQDVRQDIRQEVRHDIRQEVRHDIRQEIQHDIRQDLRHNRQDVRHDIRQEMHHDIRQELKHGIGQDVRHDIRQEVNRDIRQEIAQEIDLTLQPSLNIFPGNNMLDIPTNIPPAHASTNVEPIISTPLDLSSKMLMSGHSKGYSCQDATYMNYDTCETLDLSNKTFDNYPAFEESEGDDVIVDLSVKPSQAVTLQSDTLDLCVKSNKANNDEFTNMHIANYYPTDLSVKSKETRILDLTDKRSIDTPIIQDLSASKISFTDSIPKNMYANKEKLPSPDLSGQIMTRLSPRLNSDRKSNNSAQSGNLTNMPVKAAGITIRDLSTQSDLRLKSSPNSSQSVTVAQQNCVPLKVTPNITRNVSISQQDAIQPKAILNLTQNTSATQYDDAQQKFASHMTKARKVSAMLQDGAEQKSAPNLALTSKGPQQDTVQVKSTQGNVSIMPTDKEEQKSEVQDTHLKSSTRLATKVSINQQDVIQLHSIKHVTTKVSAMQKDNIHVKPKSNTVRQDVGELNSPLKMTRKVSAIEQDDPQLTGAHRTSRVNTIKQDMSTHSMPNLSQKRNVAKVEDVHLTSSHHVNEEESSDKRVELNKLPPNTKQKVYDVQKDVPLNFGQKESDMKQDNANNADNAAEQLTNQDKTMQKPVYNPTLKIPQYKIRSEDIEDTITVIDKDVADNTSYTNTSMKPKLNRQESTTPVYTLTNSCVTVTKIETSSAATLTNTLLGIPGSTIASTTPVYTVTGTSIEASTKLSAEYHNLSSAKYNYLSSGAPKVVTESDKATSSHPSKVEEDPETARKIAMLPKELVDILGNMPVDHRNQLLNVLPQYVSTTVASISSCDTPHTHAKASTPLLTSAELPFSDKKVAVNDKMPAMSTPQYAPDIKVASFPSAVQVTVAHLPSPNTMDVKYSTSLNLTSSVPLKSSTEKTQKNNEHISAALVQNKTLKEEYICVDTEENYQASPDIMPKPDLKSQDRIIDLTGEELPIATGDEVLPAAKVIDARSTITHLQQETSACTKLEIPKNKRNNDKTASLRAVRIKAPAERKKENQMLKASLEQSSSLEAIKCNDNDVNKLIEVEYIQQRLGVQLLAEVTSTHQKKANLTTAVLSAELTCPEVNIIESKKSDSLRDIVTEKTPDPTVKTGLAASSDPLNETSNLLKENTEGNVLANIKNSIDVPKILIPPGIDASLPTDKSILSDGLEPKTIIDKQDVICKEKLDVVHEDEDSDDDIILAAIAKQKQNKPKSHVNKTASTKKKRKEKKSKKLGKKIRVHEKNKKVTTCEMEVENAIVQVVKQDSSQSGEDENLNFTIFENNNSRRSEKCDVPEEVPDINKQAEYSNAIDKESDKNKENNTNVNTLQQKVDEKLSKLNQTVKSLEKDNQNALIPVEQNNHISILGIEQKNTDILEDNSTEIETSPLVMDQKGSFINKSKDVKIKRRKQKVKSKQKRKQCKALTSLSEKNILGQDDSCNDATTKNPEYIKDSAAVYKNISVNSYTPKDVKDVTEVMKNHEETENLHPLETVKLDCNNLTNVKDPVFTNIVKNQANNSTNTIEADVNTIVTDVNPEVVEVSPVVADVSLSVPLRRSRRGKSLYVESNVTEHFISNAESTDYKGPLTKKQLIFSKLLLDEENHTKIQKLSPEEEVANIKVDDIRDASSGSGTSEKDTAVNDVEAEQSKPLKRKKIAQSKRKYKKKKPIEMPISHNNDDTQIDTRIEIDNVAETQKLNVADQANVIEQQQLEPLDLPKEDQNDAAPIEILKDISCSDESIKVSIDTGENAEDEIPENDNTNGKLQSSIEKRKITQVTDNGECGLSSKPKKIKFSKSIETLVSDSQDNEHMNISKGTIVQIESESTPSETRPIACYNLPVAARRTRSKSVVVKSSGAQFYDPYDIDMDDMIENSEPVKKSASKTKYSKTKSRHSSKKTSETTDQAPSEDNTDATNENKKKRRKDNDTYEKYLNVSSELKPAGKTGKKSSTKSLDQNCVIKDYIDSITKNDVCDSDESSKSDVPLKKYIDDKVKKKTDTDHTTEVEKKEISIDRNKRNKDKQNKKNKRGVAISNKDKTEDVSNETEEQLRSEQFMESFGFFSERKPRKSNLLASKKISETFHIIANDSDDMYYTTKERTNKKVHSDNKKSTIGDSPSTKKTLKRGLQKEEDKVPMKPIGRYCCACKKEFNRPDNYIRHQMSLMHISRLSEIELEGGIISDDDEPNYVVARRHRKRLREAKRQNPNPIEPPLRLPSLFSILQEVNKTVRQQQIAGRGLSRDEALFLDCCELLKESHNPEVQNNLLFSESDPIFRTLNDFAVTACCHRLFASRSPIPDLDFLDKLEKGDSKSDGDVDSITAKNILESEEVRNLENDLISGLKEAASKNKALCTIVEPHEICLPNFSSSNGAEPEQQENKNKDSDVPTDTDANKIKKCPEFKEKMYPDIEEFDMFEDKFDKIKRKCRSQAAAAKQAQAVIKTSTGHKQNKSEKKKGKKISKKNNQNTVLTKGALKGFDGIKVSIPTTDINLTTIVPPHENSPKKRKRTTSRRKREKKYSETSSRYDSDHRFKDGSSQKKVDVYEFMDNEDAELFEFRPSTLMERFKSISNKETPGTSKEKHQPRADERDHSCGSVSDGDDFVYMSDDYVCSDDETENSILSCELGNGKPETKKISPLKRKDVIEKNAVMGKIFKHNAVRSEKRIVKPKETEKPKANLDQLFDSLLEDEPNSSMLNNDTDSSKREDSKCEEDAISKYETKSYDQAPPNTHISKASSKMSSPSPERFSTSIESLTSKKEESDYKSSTSKYDVPNIYDFPSTSKVDLCDIYGPSTSKMSDELILNYKSKKRTDSSSFKNRDSSARYCSTPTDDHELIERKEKSSVRKSEELYEFSAEFQDDAGVARQRARRKCTVGKQNVLAETWSSESEPDGAPARPNSAESMVAGAGRKKKGKKRDGQSSGRRGKVPFKKQEIESRVSFGSRHASVAERAESPVAGPSGLGGGGGAGGGPRPRARAAAYYWSSEGDDEAEHQQQHGWIVGDSHKKLVTMLAHAKGRKRNTDDKRHAIE